VVWPATLNYYNGPWTTQTNGWIEWEWEADEPLNKRKGRFLSTIQYQQNYNLTFSSEPPHKLRMQFQQRTPEGNASDWIIVRIYYPRPNGIKVIARG